ncbi:ABC transporter permease family protein [Diplocloster agilis]|uniref:ABC transporter type 1 GsiC-like N-terminal domain-containing protein n=1 Tax=Diplocloster agilis TaxID=2850323 RepID=A0A949K0N1_9FIRM|nr:hypothetical protein [Diplocloster agilis]MBU9738728.1 hypothetical protein [Diplocloster agilis]
MSAFIRKRLVSFVIVLVGVSILSFLLLAFSVSDPAELIARRINVNATAEQIQEVRVAHGLNKSIPEQYINWVRGFFCRRIRHIHLLL